MTEPASNSQPSPAETARPAQSDPVALPGPRALWWLIIGLAIALPAAALVSGASSRPEQAVQTVAFSVRAQTLLWRVGSFLENRTGKKSSPRSVHKGAGPAPDVDSAQAFTGDSPARILFAEACRADAKGASQPGTADHRAAEMVIASAVAMNHDAIALELSAQITNTSKDLRATLVALPAAATRADAIDAKTAESLAQSRTFGPHWSPYVRDRIRARIYAVSGNSATARTINHDVQRRDNTEEAWLTVIGQLFGFAILFGIATWAFALIRGGVARARNLPRWGWLTAQQPGLPADMPFRVDPIVPWLGFAAWLVGYVLSSWLVAWLIGPRIPQGFAMLLQGCVGILLAQAVVQAFARERSDLREGIAPGGLTRFWPASTAALRAYCALLPPMALVMLLALALTDGSDGLHPAVGTLLDDSNPIQLLTVGIAAVIIAPFGEELMFRGFLYRSLRQHCGRPVALGVTALLFALMHLDPQALPQYLLLGAAFVLVYEWVGSLWAPIILHALWNGAMFAWLALLAQS